MPVSIPSPRPRAIPVDVLRVLAAGRCDGAAYFLPQQQLDRKLYVAVDKVLSTLGGQWNRGKKAHVFGESCETRIEFAIESGSYQLPADYGWFPTPEALAKRVVDMAGVRPGMKALEPSAGEGAIARELDRAGADVLAIEVEPARAAKLADLRICEVQTADFLTVPPRPIFDRVVMNPPFAKRQDLHHVLHAAKFLAPGGQLVSIVAAGILFREDRLTAEVRSRASMIEELPEDSFRASGTSVNTAVIVLQA